MLIFLDDTSEQLQIQKMEEDMSASRRGTLPIGATLCNRLHSLNTSQWKKRCLNLCLAEICGVDMHEYQGL